MHPLYPDLDRTNARPPSLVAAEARDWVERDAVLWRPTGPVIEPSDALAIYGALALTAAVRRPCGWSGAALHGPDDLVRLIVGVGLVVDSAGRARIVHHGDTVLILRHDASKLWAGRVTLEMIWEAAQHELSCMLQPPENNPLRLDVAAKAPIRATGYDRRIVNIAANDGFAVAAHAGRIKIVGGRPGIELYALIGASVVEAAGRWLRPSEPRIARLDGVLLRDHLDAQRWMMIGEPMAVRHNIAGYRGYLT